MSRRGTGLLAILCGLALAGCDGPQSTVDSLRKDIADFRQNPGDQQQLAVEQGFAKLHDQIDTMKKSGKSAEAENFRQQEADLRVDYNAAKISRAVGDAENAIRGFGDAFRDAGRSISEAFESPSPTPDK